MTDTSKTLTDEFDEWIKNTDKGLFDGGWNFGDEDYELFERIKIQLKNQEIVERLKKRYEQFGDLAVGDMTIRSWTPGNVTSLLEEILG